MDEALKVLVLQAEEIPDLFDEIFTFDAHDGSPLMHINATKVRRDIEADPSLAVRETVHISYDNFQHILQNNGVEPAKLQRIAMRHDIWEQPVLLANMTREGSGHPEYVMIDGNHRTVIQCLAGRFDIAAYLIPRSTWEKHIVKFPPELEKLMGL